ncbi:MAG TPA: lipid II flippase MurJ, partial [Dehalococcoidia bacterium]|nr:lipid II flippase MurJ [Dehalococcoidia bacterium]
VVGAALHLLIQLPELRRQGLRFAPVMDWRQAGFRRVVVLMGPRILGLGAAQANLLVTTRLASGLPEGSLAALNYAYLLMMAPLGIFGMAISTAVFPTMADHAARKEYDQVRAMLARAVRLIWFLTFPAVALLIVLADPLVGLLFQRDQFDEVSRRMTASALPYYALGLAGHATIEIATRVFYAFHDTRTPVALSLASMVSYVALGSWLVGPLGLIGLALGLSIAAIAEGIALLVLARRRLGTIEEKRLARTTSQIVLATLGLTAISLIGVWLGERIAGSGVAAWLIALVGAGAGCAVYLGLAWLTGSRELRTLVDQLTRRFGQLLP